MDFPFVKRLIISKPLEHKPLQRKGIAYEYKISVNLLVTISIFPVGDKQGNLRLPRTVYIIALNYYQTLFLNIKRDQCL